MTAFTVGPIGLTVTLDPSCDRAELRERLAERGSDDLLYELTENVRCNSAWDFVDPSCIMAMTAAPIFGSNVVRDDYGGLASVGDVYWFPNYQVTDPVAELIEHGFVVFPKGSS